MEIDCAARLLELSCGTGRVFTQLLSCCELAVGVDISNGMLDLCSEKLSQVAALGERATLVHADICRVELG